MRGLLAVWQADPAGPAQREDRNVGTSAVAPNREIHACLCEVERGLFHVNYRIGNADRQTHQLPPYQLGVCASDAMQRIEESARLNGYGFVVWDTAIARLDALAAPEASGSRS